ncbi:hypothetical protein GGTG_00337 [Gaeumannomyces tritici R3-111a-1]|uniref:Uncharacterized protein n=1 Tax=Gaeumannomyces tritici (strain R3-111a-1) TaxID=644352 RepID=J3NGE6_GAET3|nr:hypothetical protein GGTG_00337 [Gaeumannomyces tritici R3-111a-1]EJT80336.1 hypothetical protein GGTG_00337 [Gaeumannomyces tritici R3-111a-1]
MVDHSLPSYPPGYTRNRGGLADTINTRYRLRYRKWNFVVFRGTYEDDALWAKFVALLKDNYAARLEREEAQDELGPDLEWTIIEDKALEGASRNAIRARFLEWIAARSDERDGPGAAAPWIPKECPRFKYCIYVDRACLDSLTVARNYRRGPGIHWYLRGQVVVIDGTHGHHDEDPDDEDEDEDEDEGYEPLEGNPAWDVGWTYVDAGFLTGTYESLHLKMTDWETTQAWDWRTSCSN